MLIHESAAATHCCNGTRLFITYFEALLRKSIEGIVEMYFLRFLSVALKLQVQKAS
jgi:hypothetical protein